ncbi:hypothetical protein EROM_040430 [Encephalitozoon romaleae SJ-2008]|uniref:Uncharacterized protein n=1 Tax=Encephalitozoon romaleae (strain SJ-2008) TaxID=1178016 RepID=I6ZT59_ENCRO|nr:hypothetical protein EROM_040430 [Encephalitozoon romaleae SJ-2008]AFN82811.1 hypothetical protein EROM_040430 [Encephalitozoon romaleae SJ-2008]
MEGTKLFAEASNIPFRLLQGGMDCKEFVVYNDNVFCLTGRNTLIALSSGEEYEFYGDILSMGIHEHYIYLVFNTSKVIVFDAICREVVVNFREMDGCIKKAMISSSGIYLLGFDGYLYRSTFEDIRYAKDTSVYGTKGESIIQDFWVRDDSIFYVTHYGHICKDSDVILKVFDTVTLIVPHKEYLYIVTEGNLLLKYDVVRSSILFKENIGNSKVIGDGVIGCNGMAIDLYKEIFMKVPKDTRWVRRHDKIIYISTISGIFSGSLND